MVVRNDLLRHENSYLNSTLIDEVKRRKKGKPMGLLAEEEPKYGQFWSPTKIAIRREEIRAQEDQEQQESKRKAGDKLQQRIARDERAQEYRKRVEFNKRERANIPGFGAVISA
jgi:hypothetical protein